jgi:hypothetical protein
MHVPASASRLVPSAQILLAMVAFVKIDQEERSAKGLDRLLAVRSPTASQARGMHETATSWLEAAPGGLGDADTLQRVPFHCSTSVSPPPEDAWTPTATHDAAVVQSTDSRALVEACATFGVGILDHLAPLHRDAKDVVAPVPDATSPTAVHARVPVHETLRTNVAPPPVGAASIDHRTPFQSSANERATWTPTVWPTARHHDAERHETEANTDDAVPGRATGWMLQA